MKRLIRYLTRWYWNDGAQEWSLRTMPLGRNRATVMAQGARYSWYTWDKRGSLGENWEEKTVETAKSEAYWACIKQGWL